MKEGRTYAVVSTASFKAANFASAKSEKQKDGKTPKVITSSLQSMRVSLDGKLGIVNWRDDQPEGIKGHVVFMGDHAAITEYLRVNEKTWVSTAPFVKPDIVRTAFAAMDSLTRPPVETVSKSGLWKYAAGGVAAAAAAGAVYWAYAHNLITF